MRVIVSGSREWLDYALIWQCLDNLLLSHGPELTVVHGHADRGADRMADAWCVARRVEPDRFPVSELDWSMHGRRAGPMRNGRMVAAGADLCLVFMVPCERPHGCAASGPHGSHGALNTTELAVRAGIDTTVWQRSERGHVDRVDMGGLMRCCIATLQEREEPGTEGEVLMCRWCQNPMAFRDGAWRWAPGAATSEGAP